MLAVRLGEKTIIVPVSGQTLIDWFGNGYYNDHRPNSPFHAVPDSVFVIDEYLTDNYSVFSSPVEREVPATRYFRRAENGKMYWQVGKMKTPVLSIPSIISYAAKSLLNSRNEKLVVVTEGLESVGEAEEVIRDLRRRSQAKIGIAWDYARHRLLVVRTPVEDTTVALTHGPTITVSDYIYMGHKRGMVQKASTVHVAVLRWYT